MSTKFDRILCNHNITTNKEFKKWALKNHPDKGGENDIYVEVSTAAKKRFDHTDKISCEDKNNEQKTPKRSTRVEYDPPPVATKDHNPKKAECMRSIENWSRIERHHRFDKSTFDPKRLLHELSIYSPKLVALLDNIRRIDEEDMKRDGTTYKHFIFSDVVKDGHGAKILASALVASGFSHCFTSTGAVTIPKKNEAKNTFGLLSSTAIFSSPTTQKKTKDILRIFNCRQNNVYGENMRFMVLDRGFKEGVDLFDVKYAHIFEEQRTSSDLVQTVGRGTRWCGQKGLEFVPNKGWTLHIYTYAATTAEGTPFFNEYLKLTGIDLNLRQFTQSLEKQLVFAAVDHDLTETIHRKNTAPSQEGGATMLGCDAKHKCGMRSTKTMPFTLNTFSRAHISLSLKYPSHFRKKLSKDKRAYFCDLMQKDSKFCKAVNLIHSGNNFKEKTTTAPTPSSNSVVPVQTDSNDSNTLALDMKTDLQAIVKVSDKSSSNDNMNFEEYRKYINRVFKEYSYPPIKLDNGCGSQNDGAPTRIPKLNMTQEFVSRYFVPSSTQKGMLLWHSVGTGKTCTALALKSWMFEKKGYWVLWVTRNTLRGDVWKNIVDVVCDHAVRDMITQNPNISEAEIKRKMNKRFLQPMSYKQFSNMLEGKNENFAILRNANGEHILENTLVIIDEAHKLYGNDLRTSDRADMAIVEKAIHSARTCKVLLMTGTPIEEDPMDLIKLINLINHKQLPTKYDEFHRIFLKDNEFTHDGAKDFREHVKRCVSYLNRRFDARQFAQTMFHKIDVPLSVNPYPLETCRKDAETRAKSCEQSTEEPTIALTAQDKLIAEAQTELQETQTLYSELDRGRHASARRQELRTQLLRIKERIKNMKKTRTVMNQKVKAVQKEHIRCNSRLKKDINECKKQSKNSAYQSDLLSKC